MDLLHDILNFVTFLFNLIPDLFTELFDTIGIITVFLFAPFFFVVFLNLLYFVIRMVFKYVR